MKRFAIQKHLLKLLLLADIMDWVLFTLSTTCFSKANLGEALSSRTRTLFFWSPTVMWCKSVDWIRASWLVSRRNICSLRSFFVWLVAKHRRWITLLYKHLIIYLKKLYAGPTETVKTFGRWTHKISLFSKCSNRFPTNGKVFFSSLAQKNLFGFFANA